MARRFFIAVLLLLTATPALAGLTDFERGTAIFDPAIMRALDTGGFRHWINAAQRLAGR